MKHLLLVVAGIWAAAVVAQPHVVALGPAEAGHYIQTQPKPAAATEVRSTAAHQGVEFATSDNCLACHNGLIAGNGEDVSIGVSWRASMMANSSRDPYWQASVRRETLDHPSHADAIQDECAICHMPMARTAAHARGERGRVFALAPGGKDDPKSISLRRTASRARSAIRSGPSASARATASWEGSRSRHAPPKA